jgi:hypothetical protein
MRRFDMAVAILSSPNEQLCGEEDCLENPGDGNTEDHAEGCGAAGSCFGELGVAWLI